MIFQKPGLSAIFLTIVVGTLLMILIPNITNFMTILGFETKESLRTKNTALSVANEKLLKANEENEKQLQQLKEQRRIDEESIRSLQEMKQQVVEVVKVIEVEQVKKVQDIKKGKVAVAPVKSTSPKIPPPEIVEAVSEQNIKSLWSAYDQLSVKRS